MDIFRKNPRDTSIPARDGEARMRELGFEQDESGELSAADCRVILYRVNGGWEMTLILPNGSILDCDVPWHKVGTGRTRAEYCKSAPRELDFPLF